MLSISTNVAYTSVDGADAQSRWSNNGDGSRSDGSGGGFDDVFSQVNRSTASASGTGANATGPQGGANSPQAGQASAGPGGLAALLARAKTGANGSAVLTPAEAARARALAASVSANGDAPSATPGSDVGAADPSDAASAALDAAAVDLSASFSSNGQTLANGAPSALTTLADLVGAETADVKGQTTGADSTSGTASASRRSKPVDTTNDTNVPAPDPTDAILAALLGTQAPAQALAGTGAAATVSKTDGKKAADVANVAPDDDDAADLPDKIVDPIESSEVSSIEPVSPSVLDAQVALRPAGGERTLVSVVAQATHFPVVERLSLSQQLSSPIAEAATNMPDTPTALASTAPMRTLDVTLSPGDLGSVTISMRLVGGSLHLGVEAQEAGTAQLIERDKTTLANALHASGYSVADLTIVHGAESSGQTQLGSNNASQDQGAASGSDTSGSDRSGNGGGSNGQASARDGASPQQGQSNGDGGGAALRTERGVYV